MSKLCIFYSSHIDRHNRERKRQTDRQTDRHTDDMNIYRDISVCNIIWFIIDIN